MFSRLGLHLLSLLVPRDPPRGSKLKLHAPGATDWLINRSHGPSGYFLSILQADTGGSCRGPGDWQSPPRFPGVLYRSLWEWYPKRIIPPSPQAPTHFHRRQCQRGVSDDHAPLIVATRRTKIPYLTVLTALLFSGFYSFVFTVQVLEKQTNVLACFAPPIERRSPVKGRGVPTSWKTRFRKKGSLYVCLIN